MTSSGFVKRLVWPGLLLASLTANLLFACFYMYHNWGWTDDGSAAAAVLLWPARRESASVRSVCGPEGHSAMPENITSGCYILLSENTCISWQMFSSVPPIWLELREDLRVKSNISLLKNIFAFVIWPCFVFCFCHMNTGACVICLKGSSLTLMLDGF